MEKLEPYATFVGRILISFMFVFSGIKKILFLGDTIQYMAANNVPKPEFFIFLAIVIEIIGGL
ncbi:MAG: putative membrane protein YphA (DoxX/SURF4 family), partial [Chlamydiales bacterium]